MTTAYIVEVKFGDTIHYMGPGGVIGHIPKFFNNAPRVKRLLEAYRPGYGNSRFNKQSHKDSVTVIQIKNLEHGLKSSFATLMTYDEFMIRDFSDRGLRIPHNPNAVYKIQLPTADGSIKYLRRSSSTSPDYKFGRTWDNGGEIRRWLGGALHKLRLDLKDAKVVEIEMADDGFTPKKVKTYPILDFYCASMTSRARWNRQNPNNRYTPTPEYA